MQSDIGEPLLVKSEVPSPGRVPSGINALVLISD